LLITHYFKLSATDVQEWQNNPEEFLIEEKMDAWTEKRRVGYKNKHIMFKYGTNFVTAVRSKLVYGLDPPIPSKRSNIASIFARYFYSSYIAFSILI
jgi:hypothetical protein